MTDIRTRNIMAILIIAVVCTLGVIIIGYFTLDVARRKHQPPPPPPAQTQNYSPPQNQTQ